EPIASPSGRTWLRITNDECREITSPICSKVAFIRFTPGHRGPRILTMPRGRARTKALHKEPFPSGKRHRSPSPVPFDPVESPAIGGLRLRGPTALPQFDDIEMVERFRASQPRALAERIVG